MDCRIKLSPVVLAGNATSLSALEEPIRASNSENIEDVRPYPISVPGVIGPKEIGSGQIEARLFDEKGVLADLDGYLPSNIAGGLRRAIGQSARGPFRREALRGLSILLGHGHAAKLALFFLGGPKPSKSTQQDILDYSLPSEPSRYTVRKLRHLYRRSEANRLLGPVEEPLRTSLSRRLREHSNPQAVAWALDTIAAFSIGGRHAAVYEVLLASGILSPRMAPDQVQGAMAGGDPVGALACAGSHPGRGRLEQWGTGLGDTARQLRHLVQTRTWLDGCRNNRRGLIGEALRRAQLEEMEAETGRTVLHSVFVAEQPAELAACTKYEDARDWCHRNQRLSDRLLAVDSDLGKYALIYTEIDFVVGCAQPKTGELVLERVENVKSGASSAQGARRQNSLALNTLAHRWGRLLIRHQNGHRSIPYEPHSVQTAKGVTVGPRESNGYDQSLPLSSKEIQRVRGLLDAVQS